MQKNNNIVEQLLRMKQMRTTLQKKKEKPNNQKVAQSDFPKNKNNNNISKKDQKEQLLTVLQKSAPNKTGNQKSYKDLEIEDTIDVSSKKTTDLSKCVNINYTFKQPEPKNKKRSVRQPSDTKSKGSEQRDMSNDEKKRKLSYRLASFKASLTEKNKIPD